MFIHHYSITYSFRCFYYYRLLVTILRFIYKSKLNIPEFINLFVVLFLLGEIINLNAFLAVHVYIFIFANERKFTIIAVVVVVF